jgi:hypothetical protein
MCSGEDRASDGTDFWNAPLDGTGTANGPAVSLITFISTSRKTFWLESERVVARGRTACLAACFLSCVNFVDVF